jgi:hypothetical protein
MKSAERHFYNNRKENLGVIVFLEVIMYVHQLFGTAGYKSRLIHRKSHIGAPYVYFFISRKRINILNFFAFYHARVIPVDDTVAILLINLNWLSISEDRYQCKR